MKGCLHREKVSTRDKAQVGVAISRSHGIMEGQAREFHREVIPSFARRSSGQ